MSHHISCDICKKHVLMADAGSQGFPIFGWFHARDPLNDDWTPDLTADHAPDPVAFMCVWQGNWSDTDTVMASKSDLEIVKLRVIYARGPLLVRWDERTWQFHSQDRYQVEGSEEDALFTEAQILEHALAQPLTQEARTNYLDRFNTVVERTAKFGWKHEGSKWIRQSGAAST
jgi:hypothetical protein